MIKNPAEDIFQIRLPLPFALNHVNCYALRGSDGWTIVDTGLNTEAARSTWKSAFADIGFSPDDISQIVLTHVHPDHFGMVGWLQSLTEHEIPVRVSPLEHAQAMRVWKGNFNTEFPKYLIRGGLSAEASSEVVASFVTTRDKTFPHPEKLDIIKAGECIRMGIREFIAHHAPGHSDGQLIFYDAADELMLSGDHVLMKITPNIGLWEKAALNPLADYMHTLEDFQKFKVRMALPGHRAIIEDWRGRLEELHAHHVQRLELAQSAVDGGASTAYEVAQKIFDVEPFTVHEWRFAIAETLAHLEYLRDKGAMTREDSEVWRYKSKGAPS